MEVKVKPKIVHVLMVPSIPLLQAGPLNSIMLLGGCNGWKCEPPLKLMQRLPKIGLQVSGFQQPAVLNQGGDDEGDVAAILLGDGSDSEDGGGSLWPLTKRRSAAAIPIGANYRLIDVVVSNCMNSNITNIFALTQFNSTSLNAHLNRAYSPFLQVVAAHQSPEHKAGWFQGDADAVRRCLGLLNQHHLHHPHVTHFLILPAHHLYRMDYSRLIQTHQRSKADITISCVKPTADDSDQDTGFGCLKVDSPSTVVGIKDNNDALVQDGQDLTSMGVYVINKQVIIRLLRDCFPFANDFRREVIPGAISLGMKVKAYVFEGYWDGMDSISAFYQAGMEMTKQDETGYNFFDRKCPLYTLPHCLPPSKITNSLITNTVIGGGSFLNGCRINGSVLGSRTRIGSGAVIEDSIIMGSDTYEGFIGASNTEEINVSIGVGEGSLLRKAIVDKNARIGKRVMIINKDNVREGSRQDHNYAIVDGIVVVMRSAIIPDGTIL